MAEFKISRFRYTWQGEWAGGSASYNRDDVVLYEGRAWVCIRQHTANNFYDEQTYVAPGETLASPAWVKMTDGYKFKGGWKPNEIYEPGVLVLAGGNVYLCLTSHTSSVFNSDLSRWEVFAVGSNFRDGWLENTAYHQGDVIRYNGYTYQCILGHTSSTIFDGIVAGNNDEPGSPTSNDSTAETWKVLSENYLFVGNYTPSTRYRENDLVKYGGSILKCIVEHTSSGELGDIDNENFVTYLPGYNFYNEWNNTTYYAVGDVVRLGGEVYTATTNNTSSRPGRFANDAQDNPNWILVGDSINFLGAFSSGNTYKAGDLVRRGGALWISSRDQVAGEDSTLSIFDDNTWELVIPSYFYRGTWLDEEFYNVYDVVYYRGVTYYATYPHTSSFENYPGDNGSGFAYWSILVDTGSEAGLLRLGDLLTYNLYRTEAGDGSSLGPVRIPIPTTLVNNTETVDTDKVLVVEDNEGNIGYKTWGNFTRVFFVRTNGVDDDLDPNRGKNYFKPYRTIKFALEKADDNFEGHTTILVSTGEYEEVLPLIVPARTAVVGDELRGVTVRANLPSSELLVESDYIIAALTRIGLILSDVLQGNLVNKSEGNEETQNRTLTVSIAESAIAAGIWANIIDVINYKVRDIGSLPPMTGSNIQTDNVGRLNTVIILGYNKDFLKAEAFAFIANEYPLYTVNVDKWERDLDRFIDSLVYDINHPGNYKSIMSARFYANSVIGSALEDMFYVRDATGLRNMTLKGLEGTLPELQEGDIYQIPTGGAFVSLDPGWGPDDERVWITTRSCYIQNVTTFGTAAIGQKIDGTLHNGGNKSIVSNDFTQVISDGIGAWVADGGRAELVSVFTYYAHIGMYATNGGIIRATNGNSSYGDFGALADGLDAAEVVRYGYLNTRTEQAVVEAAFAGEIIDYILALEFRNCGQEYSYATYSITSSGTGAVALQEEFRDNSMFECQTLYSGTGFGQYGNQAQLGDTLTITLAAAETATEEDILGMRIIIISGEGTGQYGYVYSYNEGTKLCTVYRESDNQPGWDNILPGEPSKPLLTTGTRYRIEPRPIFSEPEYVASEVTVGVSNYSLAAGTFGETSQTFTGLTGTLGTGATIDITPAGAVFTVEKIGREYSVTMTSDGAGYAVNDTIVIDGSEVGGITVENNITLTVTAVSDDSTNSIVSFIVDGGAQADSGKFILTPSASDVGILSSDGENWNEFTLPTSGNWNCVAAGNNRFVAIATGSNNAAYSTNGEDWTAATMPASRNWQGVVYGKPSNTSTGIFVAVASNLNSAAYSTNGVSWTASTLPTVGDSALNEWVDVAYGRNTFVAIANSGNVAATGTWNGTTLTWTGHIMDVIADSSQKDWISVAYGNRRFVAISSTGDIGYSFDGAEWYSGGTLPTQDGSTLHNWKQIRYGQGVFFAVGDTGGRTVGADVTTGPTTFAVTSYDGIVWSSKTLATSQNWAIAVFGNPDVTLGDSSVPNSKPTWVLATKSSSNIINKVYTGARALGRVVVSGQGVGYIKIWEPGSGYVSLPTLTLVCPTKEEEPIFRPRTAESVLAQPTFISKGSSYKTSTTFVTVSGDGFADKTPNGKFITLDGLTVEPGPGAQFYIGGRTDYFVAVDVNIDTITLPDGTLRSTFQVSPVPDLNDFLEHGMEVVIREKYSQVRITGHDFLDVGTGNFLETNYPDLYQDYNYTAVPFQEVYNLNGGRVFYTSTDQSGNFRAGRLFAVEQATGIITISADFFDLAGLTELRLAGVQVGSTAVIREFSKDPLFLQNSNNVIPTQRAIKSYLASRLNIGGEDLLTPSIIAGTVKVGPAEISSTAGLTIDINVLADFRGPSSVKAGVSGSMLAQTMFYRSFNFKG